MSEAKPRSTEGIGVRGLLIASLVGGLAAFAAGPASAEIISVQFQNSQGFADPAINYSGVEPDAAAADAQFASSSQWNHLAEPYVVDDGTVYFPGLIDSIGANSGAGLSISQIRGGFNNGSVLPVTYLFSFQSTQNFTIVGLAPNQDFTLFLYAFNSGEFPNSRGAVFTVGGASFDTADGTTSSADSAAVTGFITGMTSPIGTIDGTWAFDAENSEGEIDWSGFQLAVTTLAVMVPEPGTMALLASGLALLGVVRTKRSQ
jgi:PEP-CTERM motif